MTKLNKIYSLQLLEQINFFLEIQKVKKPTQKIPPQNTKNLNGGFLLLKKLRKQTLPNFLSIFQKLFQKFKKPQKTSPKNFKKDPPKIPKNLNSGSYDKFEENMPSPTFGVD